MNNRMDRIRKAGYGASLALAAIVTLVLLMPAPHPPQPSINQIDKLAHFLLFFGLVLPALSVRPRLWIWVVPLAAGFGALLEFIQPHFGRGFEWGDMLANAVGAICAVPAGFWLHRRIFGADGV